jgi:hypothetical protein
MEKGKPNDPEEADPPDVHFTFAVRVAAPAGTIEELALRMLKKVILLGEEKYLDDPKCRGDEHRPIINQSVFRVLDPVSEGE